MAARAKNLPEIRFASRGRMLEEEMRKTAREQDRKSNVRQRQIDRSIYLTTQELNDIQTRTPSPTAAPRITVSDASEPDSGDRSNRGGGGGVPASLNLSLSPRGAHHQLSPRNNNNSGSEYDSSDSSEGSSGVNLVHLRARTRRNVLLSQKLSRSLEVIDEQRARSARPPPSAASLERGAYRPVSCRSMEDLQRAATVLRHTKHETSVQQLLSSVSMKKK